MMIMKMMSYYAMGASCVSQRDLSVTGRCETTRTVLSEKLASAIHKDISESARKQKNQMLNHD
jgi:hypothetical protein